MGEKRNAKASIHLTRSWVTPAAPPTNGNNGKERGRTPETTPPMTPTCSTIGHAPHTFDAPLLCSCGVEIESGDLCEDCEAYEDSFPILKADQQQ